MNKAISATLVAFSVMSASALADDAVLPAASTPPEAATPATPTTPTSSVAQNNASDDKDPVICKREAPQIGTRVGGMRKVCRKESEWRRLKDRAKESVEGIQDRARADNPPGG